MREARFSIPVSPARALALESAFFGGDVYNRKNEKGEAVKDRPKGLTHKNAIFAVNFAAYAVDRTLREGGSSLAYSIAIQSVQSDSMLRRILGQLYHLQRQAEETPEGGPSPWRMDIKYASLPLPSGPSALDGALFLPQSLLALLETRYRVGVEQAGYDVMLGENALSADELTAAKELLVLGASPFSPN